MVAHYNRHGGTALHQAGYLTILGRQRVMHSTLFHLLGRIVHKVGKLVLVYAVAIQADSLGHGGLVLEKLLYVLGDVVHHLIVSHHHRIVVVASLRLMMLINSIVVRLVFQLVLVQMGAH